MDRWLPESGNWMQRVVSDTELIALAKDARMRAYAPYSSFQVGAALLGKNGEIFLGCNVENISYGLTLCAERVAVVAAVQAGISAFSTVAVVSDSGEPVMPCGACRQVLAEFSPGMRILGASLSGHITEVQLSELLPRPQQGILG